MLSLVLMLTACGGNNNNTGDNNNTEISEVGKKYAVKDYKTDVNFKSDNPDLEASDEEKLMYSTMWLMFKENNAVEIFLSPAFGKADTHFYAVNSENRVEFFDSEEDAKNMTNRLTNDYYGWEYQFDSSKKTLTVSAKYEGESGKVTMTIVLTRID